eukprot:CAMPEP_0173424214 /NCGR_PEP_ID=MMETSP1357-20121228/4170_1 /TAXON_ID=77926 /ORGANISM="Hemiselmis rufescens, Strain PCC563" /LENGTH=52 /DNA_ID=CAMNT_0014387389 /DNA_START=394 /DNA_END=552 /DNA_ORIENTATION=+
MSPVKAPPTLKNSPLPVYPMAGAHQLTVSPIDVKLAAPCISILGLLIESGPT